MSRFEKPQIISGPHYAKKQKKKRVGSFLLVLVIVVARDFEWASGMNLSNKKSFFKLYRK